MVFCGRTPNPSASKNVLKRCDTSGFTPFYGPAGITANGASVIMAEAGELAVSGGTGTGTAPDASPH